MQYLFSCEPSLKGTLALTTTPHRRRSALLVMITMLAATLFFSPAADAQSNPYQRGPNPTASGLERSGPYSVATGSAPSSVRGFGGGDLYYPSGTSETFGGIVVSPGFTARASSMAWYGRRLASHGFVVLVIETNSTSDQPNSRGTQLLAAADWLNSSSAPSAARARLDGSRMAVAGHSMGGGGSLAASNSRSSLKASNPLTPWHTTKSWNSNTVPQLVVGAERDSVASTSSHAVPLYNGVRSATPKMYVELAGASHFAPNSDDATISRTSVAFMKRWVDNDSRYNAFLCGANRPTTSDRAISRVMDNCSSGWGNAPAPTTTTRPGVTTTTRPGSTTTTQPPSSGTCVTARNSAHGDAGRATRVLLTYYAVGSSDRLGSSLSTTSLRQTGANHWTEVTRC